MASIVKRSPSEELQAIFDKKMDVIARSLPPGCGITPIQFVSFAIQASKTDALRACTVESKFEACVEIALLGLIPGGSLAQAYLIPYGSVAQFQLSYRGMLVLAKRDGAIVRGEARAAFDGDDFDYEFGDTPFVKHRPHGVTDSRQLTHAYAIVHFADGNKQFDVLTADEILAVREFSKAKNASAWSNSFTEMAKKSAVRRLCKMLELSPATCAAITNDDERTIDTNAFVMPKTTSPTRQPESAVDVEYQSAGDAQPESGDVPFEEQPTQRTPIDDFVARFEKAQALDDLTKIAAQLKDDGISSAKEPRLLEAFKVAKARIAQKDAK